MKIQPITKQFSQPVCHTLTKQEQKTNPKISAEIDKEMSGFVRYLGKYKNRMGESQDIIINAVGTGLVAPVFIRFNPISDADNNTKKYSAIRQTAMTVIGVTLQTLIALPLINKFLDKQLDKGALGDKFVTDRAKLKPANGKNLEKLLTENLANRRAFKRVANLIAVFAIIPLTAKVLNLTYPLFMEKFFPNTAKAVNKENTKNG